MFFNIFIEYIWFIEIDICYGDVIYVFIYVYLVIKYYKIK